MGWGMTGSQVHDEGLMAYASTPPADGERRRAVRQVASLAVDAVDCRLMLEVLGLDPAEGLKEAP